MTHIKMFCRMCGKAIEGEPKAQLFCSRSCKKQYQALPKRDLDRLPTDDVWCGRRWCWQLMALDDIEMSEERHAVWIIYRCLRCQEIRKYAATIQDDKFVFTDRALKAVKSAKDRALNQRL